MTETLKPMLQFRLSGVYARFVSYYPTPKPATLMSTILVLIWLCMSERMMLDIC